MRNSDQQISNSLLLVLAILIGMIAGQVAQAASETPVTTQPPPTSTPKASALLTGPQVYNNVCIACHSPPGVGGAPAFGSAEAWAPRIAQGIDTLINHALHGFSGSKGIMPMKGGRLDLSDEEIIGGVKYMVEQVAQ